jgi:hypothetical protein
MLLLQGIGHRLVQCRVGHPEQHVWNSDKSQGPQSETKVVASRLAIAQPAWWPVRATNGLEEVALKVQPSGAL